MCSSATIGRSRAQVKRQRALAAINAADKGRKSVPDGNPRCLKQASALIPELAGCSATSKEPSVHGLMESEHRIHGEFGIPTSCVEPEPGGR